MHVNSFTRRSSSAEALKSGKIQAVVVDKLPAELIAKNSDGKLKAVELVYEDGSNTAESYAICVAKGNDTLLEVVNKVVNELKENGKIDKVCLTCGNCAVLLRAGKCAGCVIHDREVYKL